MQDSDWGFVKFHFFILVQDLLPIIWKICDFQEYKFKLMDFVFLLIQPLKYICELGKG